MTALWKRQAERAEERQAKSLTEEEAWAVLNERMRERTNYTPINPPRPDPRGRVKLYCGRCGEWKPSDDERTLPEHWASKHNEVAR